MDGILNQVIIQNGIKGEKIKRIEENNKPKFAKEVEALLRKTRACENIEITYGSVKWIPLTEWESGGVLRNIYDKEKNRVVSKLFKDNFPPSVSNLTERSDPREFVQIKIDGRTFYQSVECSSYWGKVLDIINRLDKEQI